jgi:hypothetical protein
MAWSWRERKQQPLVSKLASEKGLKKISVSDENGVGK